MARAIDEKGLSSIRNTLLTIDEALTSHIGDAEERKDEESSASLKAASRRILEAADHVADVLRSI